MSLRHPANKEAKVPRTYGMAMMSGQPACAGHLAKSPYFGRAFLTKETY